MKIVYVRIVSLLIILFCAISIAWMWRHNGYTSHVFAYFKEVFYQSWMTLGIYILMSTIMIIIFTHIYNLMLGKKKKKQFKINFNDLFILSLGAWTSLGLMTSSSTRSPRFPNSIRIMACVEGFIGILLTVLVTTRTMLSGEDILPSIPKKGSKEEKGQ